MDNKQIKGKLVFRKAPINASAYFGDEVMATDNIDSVVSQIPIFPIGSFSSHHDMPEGFDITSADIQKFIDNFQNGIPNGRELPVYKGHDLSADRPAVGWVKQLLDRGDKGLWGVVEWTREGLDLIRNKAYKYISPEWQFDYVDPRTGEEYEDVLFAPALVNEPYFAMPAITASNEKNNNITIINNSMNLEELLKKPVAELTDEEKAFLKENKANVEMDKLSDEQKALFADEKKEEGAADEGKADEKADEAKGDDEGKADEGKKEDAGDEGAGAEGEEKKDEGAADEEAGKGEGEGAAEQGAAQAPEGDKVVASRDGKVITMTASRYEKLTAAEKEIAKGKIVASLEKTIKASSVKDKATDFAMGLGEEARGKFLEIMGMVTASVKTERTTVKGEEGKEFATAQEELNARMKAHVDSKKAATMSAAMTLISKEDPELMARVDAERAAK